ncbi:hypothetical protein E1B28_013088 [Marasmius oreades]|uniref:Uncharacterized protein n=1 Tax=Marasmius oreades TaxID=181124 RepID=A0A9P7ULK9_9AGAR|nr:uncharacterized protein E1B28_013088 [Marasmius oreades]KAG7087107.1 hypothetical protein E1B28_013088 [Marasmius oreades]
MRRYGIIITLISTCLASTAFQNLPSIPSPDPSTNPSEFGIRSGPDPGQSESHSLDKDKALQAEDDLFTLTFANPS